MTAGNRTIELDLELEADDTGADLKQSAAAVKEAVAALAGVADAEASPTDADRGDAVTIVAVLLTIRVVIADSAAAVKSLDDMVTALDDLIGNVRKLARDAGLPRLWLWLHGERIEAQHLTEKLRELAAESAPPDS